MIDLTDPKLVRLFERILRKGLGGFAAKLDDGPGFLPEANAPARDFYPGTRRFLPKAPEGSRWRLGYAAVDLTPYDYYKHDYYLGGYLTGANGFNNRVEEIVDKMQCRIVALDDATGRGAHIFAVIDCIGTGNRHIRLIRRKFADLIRLYAPEVKIASVNVFSTHTHSCVDTQGLWTATAKTAIHNLRKNRTGKGTYLDGPDPEYMKKLTDDVSAGMLRSVRDMTPGALTLAKKDVGRDYFSNRNRKSATALNTDLIRFVFTPDDPARRPTMIVSFPAHPDVAGLPTTDGQGSGRAVSGDFIYYMGELIEKAGCNFLFINGAICAIYMDRGATNDGVSFEHRWEQSLRYGREMARIALSLTKTKEEIEADALLSDPAGVEADRAESEANGVPYTLWYENWTPVRETELPACVNLRLARVKVPVTNPLIILVGKLNLASYDVLKTAGGGYAIYTEIGYLTLGGVFRAALAPGEFCQDLWLGGASLTADGAYLKKDFPFPALREALGEDLCVFGLANDAVGYIVPDNDYILGEFNNHYHELISLGERTGSTVVSALLALCRSAEREDLL